MKVFSFISRNQGLNSVVRDEACGSFIRTNAIYHKGNCFPDCVSEYSTFPVLYFEILSYIDLQKIDYFLGKHSLISNPSVSQNNVGFFD